MPVPVTQPFFFFFFLQALEKNTLHVPPPRVLPGRDVPVPMVVVADDAFPLKENIMKPYGGRVLETEKRLFNYRLSRARRVVENAFGILANRFGVFRSPLRLAPEKAESVVLASCALHNFLSCRNAKSTSDQAIRPDLEDGMRPLAIVPGNRSSSGARAVQAEFCQYFNTNGQVPWQNQAINGSK